MADAKEDSFSKARSLLAVMQKQGQQAIFQDSKQVAEALGCTIALLQSLQSSLKGASPLDPSSSDWKVVKALLELLTRLGIRPHLSPGVGIARDKQTGSSTSVFAAASAIADHLSSLSTSGSLLQISDKVSDSGRGILFICAEVMASLIWGKSSFYETLDRDMSPIETLGTFVPPIETSDSSMSPIGQTLDVPIPPIKTLHPSVSLVETIMSPMERLHIPMSPIKIPHVSMPPMEILDPPIPAITQLVMNFFVWDLMAAYLQLGFGPQEDDEDCTLRPSIAIDRLKLMVEKLPVEQMIEASFVLLNRRSPPPPPWLKAELGKQLSKLIMRTRGLAAVLEELVGRVTKGNVELYDKVAGHLAKVPKSVATADEYFKAICPQLLPLLLLNSKSRDLKVGETSLTSLSNIYHTAVSLACKLFAMEPGLAREYVVQPLMRPLLAWSSSQKSTDMTRNMTQVHCKEKKLLHAEVQVTENELVDSLVQLSVLLTAGCRGSSSAREAILNETKDVAPLLLKLHFQLEASEYSISIFSTGIGKKAMQDQKKPTLQSKGIVKGFLHQGSGVEGTPEQVFEHQTALSRLRSALADFVMAEANQPVEVTWPNVLSLLLQHNASIVRWPDEQGEVWDALHLKTSQPSSSAKYLSRLLLAVENWPLLVALMGELLHKILDLRRLLIESNAAEEPAAAELLRYMQDFEVLNNESGSTALEHDTHGAASLVKDLLEDENVFNDEDMLELVLHMVNSVLKGFRSSKRADVQISRYDLADASILTGIISALERVYSNACLGEKLRQMSFTLAKEITFLCNAS